MSAPHADSPESAATRLRDVHAVVFDLDGTLLDRRRSFERFVRHQWERFSPWFPSVGHDDYVRTVIELDGDGYAPRHELFIGAAARFGLAPQFAETLLADYRAGFPGACLLFPDAAPTLARLRASGLKLGLITNGSVRMQSRKLACLDLSSWFDAIVISQAEEIHKPDPRIFHRALAQLEVSPGRALFVGDNPDVDVAGARAAGMRAIWRRDPKVIGAVEADAIIEQVGDLVGLLGIPPQRAEPMTTLPGFDIRRATEADAAAIAAAHIDSIRTLGPRFYPADVVAVWGEGLAPDLYANAMRGGEAFFIAIGTVDGAQMVLGFATHRMDDGQDGTSVYVRGCAARQGVGTALLQRAELHARRQGATSIAIQASLAGVEFYKANGFEELGRGEAVLTTGRSMACVHMRKELAPAAGES